VTSTFTSDDLLHSITHAWLGTPGASASVEYTDGIETRRNLALNPTFTTNTTSWSTTSTVTLTRDTTQFHTGTASGKVVTKTGTGGSGVMLTSPVAENTDYVLSMWVYVPATLTNVYGIRAETNVGGTVSSRDGIKFATDGWAQFTLQYRTPVGATTLYFNPMVTNQTAVAGDTFYIDDLMIETGEDLQPYFDGSTPAITQTATVAPSLVTQWAATSNTRHIVHDVLGSIWPDVTAQPAGPRTGTMSALFDSEEEAFELFNMLRSTSVITFSDSDTYTTAMTFLANGAINFAPDGQDRTRWTVDFTYLEVQ
jgi:hypothetical protein